MDHLDLEVIPKMGSTALALRKIAPLIVSERSSLMEPLTIGIGHVVDFFGCIVLSHANA